MFTKKIGEMVGILEKFNSGAYPTQLGRVYGETLSNNPQADAASIFANARMDKQEKTL